jgi:hypothetical protein
MRAFRFSDCEGDNVVAKVRTNYKVSMRPPATLPLSPRVLKYIFLFRLSTHNSPRPASLWPFLESAVMAIVEFVSQHEEVSMRAPRFRVAYQAPQAVARDGTHAVAGDRSHAVAADRHTHTCAAASACRARRQGQGPPRTAPHVPHAGGEKKYKVSTHPPATLLLSPRVLKCIFLFWLATHNSPRPASSWPFLESAVMAIMVFVMLVNMKRFQPRFCVAYQAPRAVAGDGNHAVAAEAPPMQSRRSAPWSPV